ncbi:ribonuclease H-like domain-containing protein [Tanacetum coccineum]
MQNGEDHDGDDVNIDGPYYKRKRMMVITVEKKGYDIWAMEMEHYLEYIDNDVWKVIQNRNSKNRISTGKDGVIRVLPLVSAAEIHAVEKERKARTILLMAIPKEHLRRFHGMDYAKEIREAIRTRFGGNANSKKMQKAVLKQQFEAFTISSSEGLEKGYDRFQQLLSQLEAHGAEVSTEDANHKFLRSLPPAWSNLAMTMRTKPDVDTLSIDDLYNNLRVFEQELTSTSKSSASAQNVAFVSHSKSNTNKVMFGHTGAYSTYTPTSSNNIPEREVPAGFADEVIYSLFVKQSEDLDLLHEDLEQIDDLDIEEMDINWQIAMIAIRMKKFYKKTGRRVRIDGNKPVGFDKKKLECFKCHNTGHFARECTSKGTNDGKKRDSFYQDQGAGKKEQNQNCLLTMDDGVVNWGEHTVEEVETNHALMAISSNNEVSLCSKTCIDSYNKLKTLCDEQTNQLGEQEAKILAYNQAVKKLEAQIVTFQKQQLSLNEQLTFQANELYEKDEKLKKYRRIGMKAGPQKHETSVSDDKFNEYSTCQSNDSAGSFGNPSEHSVEFESEIISVPKEMSESKSVTTNEKVMSEPKPKEVEPSCVTHVKTSRQPMKNQETPKVNGKNWNKMIERELGEGYSFIKKKCFVCGSLSHLIRNCNFYEKKMAKKAELKKQRVFNTSNRVAKRVWNNANMVNHANHFVPRPVQLNAIRPNSNSVRPNVNTGKANVNSVRQNVNFVRSNVNTVRPKQPVPTSNSNSFSPVRPQDHPLKIMEDKGIFDSGCSGHMTGNKDHLDDFEECKGGSVTFGGSKGYITEDEDAENSSKQGRNLQEEGLDEMVRSIMKDKSEDFETPTQGKTLGEADISPEGLEAAETLAKVLTQRTKTYTRKVKTGLRRKLDADEVSTGEEINTGFTDVSTAFTDVNTAFEEINSGDESIIPSPKKGQREGKAVLEEKSQSKRTKKQIREEQASLAEIVRLQAQEEAENARKDELKRQDALIAKRVQDELELKVLSIDFSSNDFAKKMVELINEKKRLYKEQRERDRRNRPMTQAEQREYMIKYLKSQGNNRKMGQVKKLKPDELKEEFDKCINLQAEVFKKQKITDVPDVTKDESVKREEEFKVQQPILRYNIRTSLARKGLQKNKSESARSDTEEDVEAYIDERVDEPSLEEFQMGSIPQGSAPTKIVKWQILKTGKKGAYQIIREDHTDVVYVNFQGLLNDLTRDDLKELYRLMMLKYGDSRPEEEYERAAHIYMLTEVKYPLPSRVCQAMLEKRLIGDRKDEEAHNEDTQRNLKFTSEDQVRGGLLGIIVNRLKSGSYRVKSGRHS